MAKKAATATASRGATADAPPAEARGGAMEQELRSHHYIEVTVALHADDEVVTERYRVPLGTTAAAGPLFARVIATRFTDAVKRVIGTYRTKAAKTR